MPPQAGANNIFPRPHPPLGACSEVTRPQPLGGLPTRLATPAQTSPRGPVTPPNRTPLGNIKGRNPTPQLNTHPDASHPQPGDPAGISTPQEEATAAIVVDTPTVLGSRREGRGYTSSQPLPDLEDILVFPVQHLRWSSPFIGVAPAPYKWEQKFLPEHWVYTNGSDITGHPRLEAVVVHIPTNTTIYIDAAGTEETRTIMRAEVVPIHTALTTIATHDWIYIFTGLLSSFQAIRHHHINPGTTTAKPYHHHGLMLGSITDLLETRRLAGLRTTIHKISDHTNIRGNDLADAAAKLAVTHFNTLTPPQTRRVEIGEISPRTVHWVTYSVKLPPPLPALSTGTNCATLRRPWWTIPETERLHMYTCTRPSSHLRLKVRDALFRSLHHSSLYMRLIITNKEKGARTKTIVGEVLHKKLTHNPWEGTSLLKCIYGQLYNGKLAKRYGHAPTDECPLCHRPDS